MVKIEKKITFDLGEGTDLSLPDLVSQGCVRVYVTALFEKLEALGYWQFIKGKQGRGQSSKFIKNENCPKEFVLVLEAKPRGRPAKVIKPVKIMIVNDACLKEENEEDDEDLFEEVKEEFENLEFS